MYLFNKKTVAERSKASVLRSWKRKVVGSNPGDAKFDHRFSFGDWVNLIGLIAKRRLILEELELQQ